MFVHKELTCRPDALHLRGRGVSWESPAALAASSVSSEVSCAATSQSSLSDVDFRTRPRAHLPWSSNGQIFIKCLTTLIINIGGRHCRRPEIKVFWTVSGNPAQHG